MLLQLANLQLSNETWSQVSAYSCRTLPTCWSRQAPLRRLHPWCLQKVQAQSMLWNNDEGPTWARLLTLLICSPQILHCVLYSVGLIIYLLVSKEIVLFTFLCCFVGNLSLSQPIYALIIGTALRTKRWVVMNYFPTSVTKCMIRINVRGVL